MNKKIGLILALVLVAFLVMGTASAGLFDFLGGDNADTAAVSVSMQNSHLTDIKTTVETMLVST